VTAGARLRVLELLAARGPLVMREPGHGDHFVDGAVLLLPAEDLDHGDVHAR
jgi:hypothetical protein